MAVAALLLAAGESSRMGTPKPLLDWAGETLVEYQVRQLRDAGAEDVVVVLGHRADEIEPAIARTGARSVRNDRYREGRASSLRAGAEALDEPDAIVIASVDQPRPADVVRTLDRASVSRERRWLSRRSSRAGAAIRSSSKARRSPTFAPRSEETLGLRGVIGGHEDKTIEIRVEAPIVLVDVNTPEDYERAVAIAFIDRINAGEVDGLARLMTEDHELLVFTEPPVAGREANAEAWNGYATAYPNYRIYIHETGRREGVVSILGHTTGSHLGLPDEEEARETLIWQAEIRSGQVRRWRLVEDSAANRELLFGEMVR